MKNRLLTTVLVLGTLLGHAGQAHAQRPEIERPARKSPEERYEDMRKTPLLAATLEWIIPTVGHDYAGDREAGLPAAYVTGVGGGVLALLVVVGAGRDCRNDPGWDCDVMPFVGMAGAATFVASRVWASVSAWKLANRTNAFYRRRLNLDDAGLSLSVTPGGQLGLGVSLRF